MGGEHTYAIGMEAVAEELAEAVERLPNDLANHEVAALFAVLDTLVARLTTALDRVDPAADGAVTLRQWLRAYAGRSDQEAATLARRVDRVTQCPVVAAAWRDGQLTTGQVDAVVSRVSDRTQPIFAEHEPEMVGALAPLSARDADVAMRRWAAYADALVEAPLREPRERFVHLSAGPDGWYELTGHLDPAGAHVIEAALDAATTPEIDGEPARTRGQRRADAFVAIARDHLDHADGAATTRHRRPDVSVVVTLDDLEPRTGRTLDGQVLDPATIGSLLCDAGLRRVVTDGASVVLDVGRTTRTVNHHLFRALAVRDGGCRFPGCDRPVSWCEAHHIVPWQHGGATDQSNLVLLCWRHHHDFAHHRRWGLKLLPDATVEVTRPDGRILTSHPPPIG